jgi:uncharacterized membrane protein
MKVNYPALYAITASIFIVLDALWLGVIAKKLYATELKGLMTSNVKWGAAILFYALFVAGVISFVTAPALKVGSSSSVLIAGAFFGLVTYATYDLTNYATLKNFPLKIVIIDLLWGTVLSATVASLSYLVYTRVIR